VLEMRRSYACNADDRDGCVSHPSRSCLSQLNPPMYPDVVEIISLPRFELLDTNRVFEEYCRDLYKIFVYYCSTAVPLVAPIVSPNSNAHSAALNAAMVSEPRMGNSEFWKFVRDCKFKILQTSLGEGTEGEQGDTRECIICAVFVCAYTDMLLSLLLN
jgi:hypothetical protein